MKIEGNKYRKNIILNYIFKLLAIMLGVIGTRINLEYLGNNLYGLWVTIASVISWMSSGDFGIGNGLRNQLTEAYVENDKKKQISLIATGINTLSKVAVVLFGVILILCEILFKTGILEDTVRIPMYITAFFFCVNLSIGIAQSIAYSYQRSWLISLIGCSTTFFSVASVIVLIVTHISANLTIFAIVHGLCISVPNLVLMLILKKDGVDILGSGIIKNSSKKVRSSIMNIGIQFFGLQLCSVVLYSTDNLIINYLLSSEMVTRYSIITRIYDTGSNIFSIMLISLWSAVTLHMAQNDYGWIVGKVKDLLKIWGLFSLGVVGVSLFFNQIIQIWVGAHAEYYGPEIIVLFGLYCSMTALSAIFVNVLNGLGVIKLQLKIAVIGAVINIPLSVFFAKFCNMGIFGVKLATFMCALLTALVTPIQAVRVIRKLRKQTGCIENH